MEIKKFLSNNKWKGVRHTTKGLYALEIEYNDFNEEDMGIIAEAFKEPYLSKGSQIVNSLISTTLRILSLDNNSLGDKGSKIISSFLDNCRCLVVLSLSNNNIAVEGSDALATSLTTNTHLRYLNLSFNPLTNFGVSKLGKCLRVSR